MKETEELLIKSGYSQNTRKEERSRMSHTRIHERMVFLIGELKIAREEKN